MQETVALASLLIKLVIQIILCSLQYLHSFVIKVKFMKNCAILFSVYDN
ncbi:hypothetical protein MXB_3229 [Myxobolus squamalis]|nr:hypothetical protein MXB_3229 [Myxobolus squamalis]